MPRHYPFETRGKLGMDIATGRGYCHFSSAPLNWRKREIDWIAIAVGALAALLTAVLLVVMARREQLARRRFQILADIAAVSEAGGSLEETLDAICAILVPQMGDFCMIDVIDEDRVPRRAAVRVAPGGAPGFERGLTERMPSIPPRMIAGDGSSMEPRFYERMSEEDLRGLSRDEDDLEFLRGPNMRSAITVGLQARGEVTGALTIAVAWSGRRYRGEDARFAWILSGRVALALDNSGLFADLERAERARAEIAETLQHGLLPSPLPHVPGWSIAAMYRPAGAQNEVGGDFYDVFRVPGGWMLVIGDVTGRGARAASITAVARHTLRTAAVLTDDPQLALGALNRALLARGDSALCSLAAMTLSEDRFEPVRVAVAGHPPPLLVDGERVTEVAGADPVLGAFADAEWGISRAEVEPGQQLVVVTDGITEAQGPDGRFGETRLHEHLSGATNPALVVQQLETSLHAFTDGRFEDDVAMLAIARVADSPPAYPAIAGERPAPAMLSLDNGDA
jgi:serine phosphatase RsbU (regulator of sigma subunit)